MENKKVLSILELCMELNEYGVDAFFNYSPHINGIEVRIYKDRWSYENDPSSTYSSTVKPEEYLKGNLDEIITVLENIFLERLESDEVEK